VSVIKIYNDEEIFNQITKNYILPIAVILFLEYIQIILGNTFRGLGKQATPSIILWKIFILSQFQLLC
jgi:Na+-driven multidrug efflux pump